MSHSVDSIRTHVAAAYPAHGVAWYATILLAVLYWLSVLDRFIISLLVEPIKRDLGLTDLQFGMLHGFAFAATFAIFGLAFGVLADRFSRRWVIFAGVSVWSVATALCGVAQNYWHLLLARIGVGAGEAALNPCATSMLADMFPPQRLTLPMAVYAMGASVGVGTAFLIGGVIVELVSQAEVYTLPLIGAVRSWQAVFFIVGVPGALLSLIIFTVPEPARRGQRAAAHSERSLTSTYRELLAFMKLRPRFFLCHYAGFAFASAVVAGGGGWYPVHMGRAFGWTPSQIGLYLGLTLVAAALIGNSITGRLIDAMFRGGYKDAQLRWYAGALVAAVPVGVFTFTSDNAWLFLGGIALYLMLIQPFAACCYTALNLVTPNHLRGTGVAFFGITAGLIGGGTGPILIPAAAKLFADGNTAIGQGLATVIALSFPIAAGLLAFALRGMREAVTANAASSE